MKKYNHGEAFCIMEYRCQKCQQSEFLWNSRDGVTPFIIECSFCDGEAQHVNWRNDERRLDYLNELKVGQRFFRDLKESEATGIAISRLKSFEGTDYAPPPEGTKEREDLLKQITKDIYGSGDQPTIDVYSE